MSTCFSGQETNRNKGGNEKNQGKSIHLFSKAYPRLRMSKYKAKYPFEKIMLHTGSTESSRCRESKHFGNGLPEA